jgi:hypothetical protein
MTGTVVTGISDDWYKSTIEVIVIGFGKPRSAREYFGFNLNHLGVLAISLGLLVTCLGAPGTLQDAPATSLGAP